MKHAVKHAGEHAVHDDDKDVRGRRRRRGGGWVLLPGVALAAGLVATACFPPGGPGGPRPPVAQVARVVHLNQVQVVGSHNSYHVEAPPLEAAIRESVDPAGQRSLEYGHLPLPEQFATQNVRQIELDVFADPNGGLYADPLIRAAVGEPPYDQPAMSEPGIKVLHIQDIDYHTTCLTFVACLEGVKAWSDANPGHLPIAVLVELKDTPIVIPGVELPFVVPPPFDAARMDELDAEIRSVFPARQLITPDDVRGRHATLEEAVLRQGWPTLARAKGKVMFLMDNGGSYRRTYLEGHPSLRGRVLFTNAEPGDADAAFVKRNDPVGAANQAEITDLVRRGYVVRTRADADTEQARTGDTTMRDAALASGAQWVSTDYPAPGIAARFGTDYYVAIPGGTVARCNPVNAPRFCFDRALERLR